jgi:NADPH:quinone reductase
MKAMAISQFSTDPVMHELPAPRPGEGEVLVNVEFASVNGMDVMTMAGMIEGMMPYELPITLGRDFSGTVAAVGHGVTGFAPGDPVFGVNLKMPLHDGTFAEQVAVPAACTARRPDGLAPDAAGALGLAGITAKLAVDALAPAAGELVLICGATGGVGAIAVQLAKKRGAHVIATATPDAAGFVRDLGADEIVDYTGDLAAVVRQAHPAGVHAALHAAGDGMTVADLVAPGGRMASTLGIGPGQVGERDIQATAIMAIPSSDDLAELAAAVDSGWLRVPVTKTYPLGQAAQAIKEFASGTRGKLAIAVR